MAKTTELFEKLLSMSPRPDDVIEWVKNNLNPEDVFSTTQLDKWAESEGYVKQTENQ